MATPEEEAAAKLKKEGDTSESKPVVLKPGETVVSSELLEKILAGQGKIELELEEERAKRAGLEALMETQLTPEGKEKGLREKKNYEPKFRTIRIRKFPIAGNVEDMGYVIGWTNRGAYHKVVQTGMGPREVDYIDVIFLGKERNTDGKLQAETIPLLDLLNKGEQVVCKIIKTEREDQKIPTGEELDVTTWDPQHGLVMTGDKIDGYVVQSDIKYTIQIPDIAEPLVIDAKFCN